jgi:hypothetical protein
MASEPDNPPAAEPSAAFASNLPAAEPSAALASKLQRQASERRRLAEALRENSDVKEFYLGMSQGERKTFRDVKHYKRRKRWLA